MQSEYLAYALVALVALVGLSLAVAGVQHLLGFFLRLFTAPGVVVHEFAHASVCRLLGVPVFEAVYFRFGDPPGYVRHARPERYRASFAIGVAPFLVNTVLALAAFAGAAALAAGVGDVRAAPPETLAAIAGLGWVGLSVGMHAFPSTIDASELWSRSRSEWRRSPAVLLGVPFVAAIYLANLLSRLWAHLFYAVGLAVLAGYPVWQLLA